MPKMKKLIIFLLVSAGFFLSLTVQIFAENDASIMKQRRDVLNYGLNSEVLELVKELYLERNTDFLPELKTIFEQSQNVEIRQNVLSLFLELKNKALLKPCESMLSDSKDQTNSLLLTAVSYLTELKDEASIPIFAKLLTNSNKILAQASIRALGQLKAIKETQTLIDFLKNPDTDDNFKPDIYWALGEMKAVSAVDVLTKAYDSAASDPLTQQIIVESLGKIGDPSSWSRIEQAFESTTTSLKSKALQAMIAYEPKHPRVKELVGAGLRDSQVPVRLAAAAVEEKIKDPEWQDLLTYRIKNDPSSAVRVACAKALSSLPDNLWQPTFLHLLEDRNADFETWRIVLDLSLKKKIPGALEALKALILRENKDQIDNYTPTLALQLLSHREQRNRELYGLLLLNNKASTRMMALRAISADGDKEYVPTLQNIAKNDDDGAVRELASSILKSWKVAH